MVGHSGHRRHPYLDQPTRHQLHRTTTQYRPIQISTEKAGSAPRYDRSGPRTIARISSAYPAEATLGVRRASISADLHPASVLAPAKYNSARAKRCASWPERSGPLLRPGAPSSTYSRLTGTSSAKHPHPDTLTRTPSTALARAASSTCTVWRASDRRTAGSRFAEIAACRSR